MCVFGDTKSLRETGQFMSLITTYESKILASTCITNKSVFPEPRDFLASSKLAFNLGDISPKAVSNLGNQS